MSLDIIKNESYVFSKNVRYVSFFSSSCRFNDSFIPSYVYAETYDGERNTAKEMVLIPRGNPTITKILKKQLLSLLRRAVVFLFK
ncbi:hypothetical protein DOK67_0002049 [Enterococcus sp. DIV0212c]